MTPYEAGFAAGEQSSWLDRGRLQKRIPPQYIHTERDRGFWDGYTPRSPVWAIRRDPRPHWQQEREREEIDSTTDSGSRAHLGETA